MTSFWHDVVVEDGDPYLGCAASNARPRWVSSMRMGWPLRWTREIRPASMASSHTVSLGHDVRQASMTSAYSLGSAASHARKSIVSGARTSDMTLFRTKWCARRAPDADTVQCHLNSSPML